MILSRLYRFIDDVSAMKELKSDHRKIISKLKRKKLTNLSKRKLVHIVRRCRQVEHNSVSGLFLEVGYALVGTSILISSFKNADRRFKIYDIIGAIPPPRNENSTDNTSGNAENTKPIKALKNDGNSFYMHENEFYEKRTINFKAYGINPDDVKIEFIKGSIQDNFQINVNIAFAHIDLGLYEPVKICLESIFPQLSLGGYIILDDYYEWGGCRKATDEYLKTIAGQYELRDKYRSLSIKRISY